MLYTTVLYASALWLNTIQSVRLTQLAFRLWNVGADACVYLLPSFNITCWLPWLSLQNYLDRWRILILAAAWMLLWHTCTKIYTQTMVYTHMCYCTCTCSHGYRMMSYIFLLQKVMWICSTEASDNECVLSHKLFQCVLVAPTLTAQYWCAWCIYLLNTYMYMTYARIALMLKVDFIRISS